MMYLFQRAASSWDPGFLWKTTNGGQSWTSLPLPPGYARRVVLTLSAEEEEVLWLAYTDGANGQKVYKSVVRAELAKFNDGYAPGSACGVYFAPGWNGWRCLFGHQHDRLVQGRFVGRLGSDRGGFTGQYFYLYFEALLPGSQTSVGCVRERRLGDRISGSFPPSCSTYGE